MPALAAGPLACGSATSAPSAFLRSEAVGDIGRHRLNLDADPAAADRALVLELGDDALHGGGRNRERDADAAARRRIDRGVDADHLAFGVEGRAAGIALVHRRVDLDEIVIWAVADVAAAGRDDAGRDGAAETERIADREHPIADPRLVSESLANGKFEPPSTLISARSVRGVGADHLGLVGLAVIGRHLDLVGAVDHVIVGDRVAIGGNEEAGTLAGHHAVSVRAAAKPGGKPSGPPKRRKKRSIGEPGWNGKVLVAIVLGYLLVDVDLDRNHRRLHTLDDIGKANRLRDLADLVIDLRMRGAGENIDRHLRGAEAVNGDPEAANDRSHQREFSRGKQLNVAAPDRTEARQDRLVGQSFRKSPEP